MTAPRVADVGAPDWHALRQFVRPDLLRGIRHDFEARTELTQRDALNAELAEREAMLEAAGW